MVKVKERLPRRALVIRGSARELGEELALEAAGDSPLVIDFDGIDGVSPAFVDEILTMLDEAEAPGPERLVFANLPTRLSRVYTVLAGAHSKEIELDASGERETWILTPAAAPTAG